MRWRKLQDWTVTDWTVTDQTMIDRTLTDGFFSPTVTKQHTTISASKADETVSWRIICLSIRLGSLGIAYNTSILSLRCHLLSSLVYRCLPVLWQSFNFTIVVSLCPLQQPINPYYLGLPFSFFPSNFPSNNSKAFELLEPLNTCPTSATFCFTVRHILCCFIFLKHFFVYYSVFRADFQHRLRL